MPETTNDIILLSAGIGATPMQAFLGSNNRAGVKKTVHVDRKASENPFHNKWLASGIDYTIVESGSVCSCLPTHCCSGSRTVFRPCGRVCRLCSEDFVTLL